MSNNAAQNWHKERKAAADEMTVRLGPLFAELCHWAVNEQIEEALDLCEKMLAYKRQLSTNAAFFGARLTDCFRWARQFGVESPDWRELDIDEAGRAVHPGLISEDDYLDTLSRIGTDPELDPRQRLMMGSVSQTSPRSDV